MAKATVTITADNKIKKGIDPAKKSMLEFQTVVDGIQKKISKAFTIAGIATAAVASFKAMSNAAKQCISEYTEAEKVFKRLDAVWKNVGQTTGKTYNEIMAYADAVEKTTYFTGEAVEEAALLLASTESLTKDGFQKALDVSVDLAAALGEDVTSAASTLAKAIQEPESALSRLKTIGVSFTEDEKNQIKALTDANKVYEAQNLILEKVEQKYKGVAKAINATPAGTLDNIKDTLGDIRENIGGALLDVISPALESLYGWLLKISEWVADSAGMVGVFNKAESGSSLTGVSDELLQKARNEAWNKAFLPTSIAEDEMNAATGTNKWFDIVDVIDKELKRRAEAPAENPVVTVVADKIEGMETAVTGLVDFLSGNASSSASAQRAGYQAIIDSATKWLEGVNEALNASSSFEGSRDIALSDLGLSTDTTDAQLRTFATQLGEIIATNEAKLNPPTEETIEPTELEKILDSYGNKSKSFQLGMIDKQISDIEAAIGSANSDQLVYLYEMESALYEEKSAIEALPETLSGTFLDSLTNVLSEKIQELGFGEGQSSSAAGALVGTAIEGMGEAGQVAEKLATNMAVMGPALGAIVTALQYVLEGLMEVVGEALGEQLMIVVDALKEVGKAIGSIILPFIKLLTPLLQKLTEPILFLTGTFQYAGQAIQSIVAKFVNWLGSLRIFGNLHMSDPGMPGNYATYMENYKAGLDGGSAADSASTSTAISSASYRGATQVTINIYQMSPVVGSNGMREFASMIRDEFEALDYYGVSA